MKMNTDNSKKIYKKAKESIPGGVNSPVRAFQSVDKEYPIFIKSGNGSKLYDEDGNEYVDMIGTWGPMILGHNYPKVLEVVKKELENGTSFGLPTKKEVELAELVKKTVHFEGDIIWDTGKPNGTPRKLINVDKLHRLGWTHKVEIETGVEKLYAWYQKSLK